jgi:hypothetical protein
MWEGGYEPQQVELDEIDLGFCYLHVLIRISPCGFTQQLGEYRMNKAKVQLEILTY